MYIFMHVELLLNIIYLPRYMWLGSKRWYGYYSTHMYHGKLYFKYLQFRINVLFSFLFY